MGGWVSRNTFVERIVKNYELLDGPLISIGIYNATLIGIDQHWALIKRVLVMIEIFGHQQLSSTESQISMAWPSRAANKATC